MLQGMGASIALPFLDAMVPRAAAAVNRPTRLAFVYVPNGMNMSQWYPDATGPGFRFSKTLKPLEKHRDDILVLSGLAQRAGTPGRDGAGDHARANATYLTGVRARKTAGSDIRLGISIDQVAANKIGHLTRLPSLELSCDRARQSGRCDSGYSCAYQYNLSWASATTPMAPESSPRLAFDRLFGSGDESKDPKKRARDHAYTGSILDFVMEDAKRLQKNLGATDRRKLEEYLTAVRDVEVRIENSSKFDQSLSVADRRKAISEGEDFADHVRMMFELMTLAFQTDTTRIATFLMAHDGSDRSYPIIGVRDAHHRISHHGRDREKLGRIAKIDHYHVGLFAEFVEKLKSTPDGNDRLIDNCMISYGSGLADGDRHDHHNLPLILAGRGGGSIRTGQHVKVSAHTPMSNLHLSMLDRLGVKEQRFADSTGRLEVIGSTQPKRQLRI
tara:strand:+ start:93 stop:1427 length:1335 start_codon:yes stop_codon:yes gene_type:complete